VKGLFIVHGADDTSSFDGYIKGRAYLVDNVQATSIAERAYKAREEAGVLPDHAVAEEVPVPDELMQAIEVLRSAGVTSMRSEEVASQLETTPQRLVARIGVKSRHCGEDGWLKHLYLEDLEAKAGPRPGLRVVS
jgi:hypothetical protein